MANLMASIESIAPPDPLRRRPQLILRGERRKFVRHLLRALEVIQRSDVRERARSEARNYTPVLFGRTTALDNKTKDLVARCKELLEARG